MKFETYRIRLDNDLAHRSLDQGPDVFLQALAAAPNWILYNGLNLGRRNPEHLPSLVPSGLQDRLGNVIAVSDALLRLWDSATTAS